MGRRRQLTCECGEKLEETMHDFEGFSTKALYCKGCGHIAFTGEQADEYVRLKRLADAASKPRKVIIVGNSMGITLPEEFRSIGFRPGKMIKIAPLSKNSLRLTIV